jgi:hypothetical protein
LSSRNSFVASVFKISTERTKECVKPPWFIQTGTSCSVSLIGGHVLCIGLKLAFVVVLNSGCNSVLATAAIDHLQRDRFEHVAEQLMGLKETKHYNFG